MGAKLLDMLDGAAASAGEDAVQGLDLRLQLDWIRFLVPKRVIKPCNWLLLYVSLLRHFHHAATGR